MIELVGNIWDFHKGGPIAVTTNGDINKLGKAVMGRGIASQAATRFPDLAYELASALRNSGNIVNYFEKYRLYTFPVKHHWNEKADIELIKNSCMQLVSYKYEKIFMVRPGCGNGQLLWDEVRLEIVKILDDRVRIVNYK